MQIGQFHGVADLIDLRTESPDVVIVDVGDLFKDKFLDFRLWNPLVDIPRASLHQERIAGSHRTAEQGCREEDDAFFVGATHNEGTLTIFKHFLEGDDLALTLESARGNDVHRLVQHDLLAGAEAAKVHVRTDGHADLAARCKDVNCAVFVAIEKDSVTARWLRQPVDFFLESDDLIARLTQSVG